MTFFTVINCIDGRIQLPVIQYLQQKYNVEFIDSITEAGPNLILADNIDSSTVQSIYNKLNISFNNHKSEGLAIVGHYGCAGNPASKNEQIEHIQKAIKLIQNKYNEKEIIGLWVDHNFEVHED